MADTNQVGGNFCWQQATFDNPAVHLWIYRFNNNGCCETWSFTLKKIPYFNPALPAKKKNKPC